MRTLHLPAVSSVFFVLGTIHFAPSIAGAEILCPTGPEVVKWVDTPGVAWSITVEGFYAFVGDGDAGLQVLDVTLPEDPQIVGTWESSPRFVYYDVAAQGNVVYCGLLNYGLAVLDVSNPNVPVLRDSLALPGETRGMAVSGDLLFLAGVDQGFHVVDVTNPDFPSLITTYGTVGDAMDVAVGGNRLYVAEFGERLSIFDLSNPVSPMELGFYPVSAPRNVVVDGNYAYLVDGTNLVIIDVSNPANPMFVSETPTLDAPAIAVSNGYVYLTTSDLTAGLEVFDVSNPAAPALVSRVIQGATFWPGVAVNGDFVYATSQQNGILVVDATNKNRVDPVGTWVPQDRSVWDVQVDGGLAVCLIGSNPLVGGGDLEVVDVSTPGSPVSLATVDLHTTIRRAVLRGDHAYAVSDDTTLAVIDLAVPGSPNIVGVVDSTGRATAVAVAGDMAYVSGEAGFYTVDVSDPQDPLVTGTYMDGWAGTIDDIQIEGSYAYLIASQGFQILDVSNPGDPSWVSTTNFTYFYENPEGALGGDYLYLPPDEVYNISNPASPVLVAGFRGLSAPGRVLAGDRVYLAGLLAGFHVQDATDPADPVHVGTVATSRAAHRIRAVGNLLYVADGPGGLRIYGDPCTVVPVRLVYLVANWDGNAAVLEWETVDESFVSFHVHREDAFGTRVRLTSVAVTGASRFSYRDPAPPQEGARYFLEEIGRDGASEWHDPVTLPPAGFTRGLEVSPGIPTPFASRVKLAFTSPRRGKVAVRVLDIQGRLVTTLLDRNLPAGPHELEWTGIDGSGQPVPAGVYFYRVDAGGETRTQRLVRLWGGR